MSILGSLMVSRDLKDARQIIRIVFHCFPELMCMAL